MTENSLPEATMRSIVLPLACALVLVGCGERTAPAAAELLAHRLIERSEIDHVIVAHDLERHPPSHGGLLRLVDDPHPPAADLLQDCVLPKLFWGLPGLLPDRLHQMGIVGYDLDKFQDLTFQFRISSALLGDVGGAVCLGEF